MFPASIRTHIAYRNRDIRGKENETYTSVCVPSLHAIGVCRRHVNDDAVLMVLLLVKTSLETSTPIRQRFSRKHLCVCVFFFYSFWSDRVNAFDICGVVALKKKTQSATTVESITGSSVVTYNDFI